MYNAIVAKIDSITPIQGADRIVAASVLGYTVVVGRDSFVGQIGVFFPTDGQLSEEFCTQNNLYREGKGSNREPSKYGYLDEARRVKNTKLKGVLSEGIFFTPEAFVYTGVSNFTIGQTFTELNSKPICNKYMTEATIRAKGQQVKAPKLGKHTEMFFEHYDTEQLRYYIDQLPHGLCIITSKLHGTSGRTANVLVTTQPNGWRARANHWLYKLGFGFRFPATQAWEAISGTRHTVFKSTVGDGYHGGTFRQEIHTMLANRLHKGETLYYEIVGWEGPGRAPIMHSHTLNPKDPVHKDLIKAYNTNKIVFSYGCPEGTYDIYVYRITHTNLDNVVTELSWNQIKTRCLDLGVKYVPEIAVFMYEGNTLELLEGCKLAANSPSPLDPRHMEEGVCVRIETGRKYGRAYKFKSPTFQYLEGNLKEHPDYVDSEEST